MKINKVILIVAILQIFLLLNMEVSDAYSISQFDKNNKVMVDSGVSKLKKIIYTLMKIWISDRNLASALESSDLANGVWTCVKAKDGSLCQEYIASECNSKCVSDCIPSKMVNVAECSLGTCYDSDTGECNSNSPKSVCENMNNTWYYKTPSSLTQCRRGCCQIGAQYSYITSKECSYQAGLIGMSGIFRSDVTSEVGCYLLRTAVQEGACVYGSADADGKRQCKFTSKQSCQSVIRGEFYQDYLCSNSELNTVCEKMQTTGCFNGKDEVYWFDSCGNKENIWSSGTSSWNGGKVLSKTDSCSIGSLNNPLANKNTCGNCNYFTGSICGSSGSLTGNAYQCQDLNCVDKNGDTRLNGESWCEYQGSVGLDTSVDKSKSRSTETVGSTHFRMSCIQGEIITESCGDYRNKICVEERQSSSSGETISSAACKMNAWQICLDLNTNFVKKKSCEKTADCFLKAVAADDFKFNICLPRYAPGYSFEEDYGETAESLCSTATQTCTKQEVKKLSGWKCYSGCECDTSTFTHQMNDLCISLGDCGAKANYLGDMSESYSVSAAVPLDETYLSGIKKYAYEDYYKGKYIPANHSWASYGYPSFYNSNPGADPTGVKVSTYISGGIGAAGLLLAKFGMGLSGSYSVFVNGVSTTVTAGTTLPTTGVSVIQPTSAVGIGPYASALGSALTGAAIGLAVVSLLLSSLGISRGLDAWMTYTLMAAGAVGVGLITMTSSNAGMSIFSSSWASGLAVVGWILVIVVVVVIIIFKVIGIGKLKKRDYSFTCEPWEAKNGGDDCKKCGSDGYPCSSYACKSLGQNCQMINADSDNPECININPDDVSPPVISPWTSLISSGYNYTSISDAGFKIIGPSGGCMNPGTTVVFGLQLSEHGQCKYSMQHTDNFKEMNYDFGVSRLFRKNHTEIYTVPTLGDLGYGDSDTSNVTMFIRCQDKTGNANVAEYAIQYCISKGVDVTPPMINSKMPDMEYLPFGVREQNVTLYTDEDADCRWDHADLVYDLMRNNMSCRAWKVGISKGICEGTWSEEGNNTNIYVRCKDHPELAGSNVSEFILLDKGNKTLKYNSDEVDYDEIDAENDGKGFTNVINVTYKESEISNVVLHGVNLTQSRNENVESTLFHLKETKEPLVIKKISPAAEDKIEAGTEPTSIDLRVETDGGIDYGNSMCTYQFGETKIPFAQSGTNLHLQTLNQVFSGEINVPVECMDIAGNIANDTAVFNVFLDVESPRVTRAYSSGKQVTFVTDEDANCYYSEISCDYEISNSTQISGESRVHTFGAERGNIYYIKCKDRFDWDPGSRCSIIIKPMKVGA